jgi:serine/threonine protein kinase
MPLPSGARLGPYEITAAIGAGGMGEVYRATDRSLGRDVAIKVLPDAFAADPDRLARFEREAKTLASLNHPNIAAIYGFEASAKALVMELVEGRDLSAVVAAGPLAPADALPIARQIAEALEYAHESGVIHRDLKPANVKVRSDGVVKVLDFGLAKALGPEGSSAAADLANSPTVTGHVTEHGVLLGTAAYMAPEQARGKAVDKRADIWAFGAVLYEMLTGTRAFTGGGLSDVLAAVVRHEIDWSRLPAGTPASLRQLLARCLEPDVKQRLRDIGEARVAIAAIERDETGTTGPRNPGSSTRRLESSRVAWTIAALAILAAGATFVWHRMSLGAAIGSAGADGGVARLSVLPPAGAVFNPDSTNVAISPNGRMVAFIVGNNVSSENQLWVRDLDSAIPRRIEGGDGAAQPFWSPNSERIGFFAARKLKTAPASGGPSLVVCDAPFGRGATWNASNVIVFAPDSTGPLHRVSANGGTSTPVTTLDAAQKETGHRFPHFLPDGDHFLFAALPGTDGMFRITAGSLKDPAARTIVGSLEDAPVYSEPGWLLFTRQGVLTAQGFDLQTLRFRGDPVSLGDQPAVFPGAAAYDAGRRISASATGSLAYYLDAPANTNVQWIDQTGKVTGTVSAPPGRYTEIAVAPDSRKAVLVRSDSPMSWSLWLLDLTRASAVPLGAGVSKTASPVWSPDSSRIAYFDEREGVHGIFEKIVSDGSPRRSILQVDDSSVLPRSWSDEGIIFNRVDPGTKWNIYQAPPRGSSAPVPLVNGPSIEIGGWPSPDRRWLAYLSDETGHFDLFVQSASRAGQSTQIPVGGTQQCWWMPDGRSLLCLKRDQTLWRVVVDLRGASPRVDAPVQLATFPSSLVAADLAPDGRRFLALVPERTGLGAVTVVQFWRAALPGAR